MLTGKPVRKLACSVQLKSLKTRAWLGRLMARRANPDIYRTLGGTPRSFLAEENACAYATRLRPKLVVLNEERPPKHSAISQGVYEIHVLQAASLPLGFPETRPRYE